MGRRGWRGTPVELDIARVRLLEAGTGDPVELGGLSGVGVVSLIRHRY